MGMISCPNDTLSPVVIITSDAVQVDLILQEFVSVTGRMWSSVVMTMSELVMLGVILDEVRCSMGKAVKGLLDGAACRQILAGCG